MIQEFNGDQRREKVNSDQRFAAWRTQRSRMQNFRGSLVWQTVKGETYLARSYYDQSGLRRQKSEGKRTPETESIKADWEYARAGAREGFKSIDDVMTRQASINRVIGLGRVPTLSAKIVRVLDEAQLLGRGLRVVGTNAIYAYESAAGVFVDSEVTATLDIDILLDARRSLRFVVEDGASERSLVSLLRKADRSFEISQQDFRAVNKEGFLVDLIKPQPNPPWSQDTMQASATYGDLVAAPIEGLDWLENAPSFDSIAIDEQGWPVRISTIDPRVFAAHKLWLSKRADREPTKRQRDRSQAQVVGQLTARYLPHLPYEPDQLRMLPLEVFEDARALFEVDQTDSGQKSPQ